MHSGGAGWRWWGLTTCRCMEQKHCKIGEIRWPGRKTSFNVDLGSWGTELTHFTVTFLWQWRCKSIFTINLQCHIGISHWLYTLHNLQSLETNQPSKKLQKPKKKQNQQGKWLTGCYFLPFNNITITIEFGWCKLDVISCVLGTADGYFSYRGVGAAGGAPCRRGAGCRCGRTGKTLVDENSQING